MDVAAVQSALDKLKEQSRERLQKEAKVSPDLDEVIESLAAAMGDYEEREGLKKEAYLARREDLTLATWLAGLDALVSLES